VMRMGEASMNYLTAIHPRESRRVGWTFFQVTVKRVMLGVKSKRGDVTRLSDLTFPPLILRLRISQ
jgi:hypothetical protein